MTLHTGIRTHHAQTIRHPLTLAVALALAPFVSPLLAQDLPRVGVPVGNSVSFSHNPTENEAIAANQSMTITQSSKGAIINWGSFNIGASNTVTFDHQVAGGVTLNRVIGFASNNFNPSASTILGAMNAPHGSVFLINPNGVLFGAGSSVNVGGLIASTLAISDGSFNAGLASGSYVFGNGVVDLATVENDGTITANPGGSVVLLGGRLQNGDGANSASISAPQGTVALGVGSQITVNIGGDGLTQLQIDASAFNGNGTYIQNSSLGTLMADGGQVLMQALGNPFANVVNYGIVQAHSMTSRAGRIILSSASDDGISNKVLLQNGTLDTSGSAGGGTIDLTAQGVASIDRLSTLNVDATNNGNGGAIVVNGQNGIHAFGAFSAKGGPTGGNGGTVQLSGGGFDLRGIRVDASAGSGDGGTLQVEASNDVTIVHGNEVGDFPCGFGTDVPVTTADIQDHDISNTLGNDTNVTVQTTASRFRVGDVTFDNADIERSGGTGTTTLRIDANGSIDNTDGGGSTIASTGGAGAVNVAFNANANSAYNGDAYNGKIDLLGMTLRTNGGSVILYGQSDPINGYASASQLGIHFDAGIIDTRVNQSNAGAGGSVTMRGVANDSVLAETGIDISGSSIATSTGAINLRGSVATGDDAGVGLSGMLVGRTFVRTSLSTTSGNITLDGTSLQANDQANKWGVRTADADIFTQSGNISISGRAEGTPNSTFINRGVQIGANTHIVNGSGRTLIAGEASSASAGVEISAGATISSGSGAAVIQARNDGRGDALVVNGTLTSTGAVDLRPGGVDVNGSVTDTPNDAIALGGTLGFAVSASELSNIAAINLVLGSSTQVGRITVAGPINYNHNLTLDAGSASGITINGALNVGTNTLALISAGNITQSAPITAASLLVTSRAGAVTLTNAANQVSVNTLAGSAAADFSFVNAGSVGIGNVTASGFDAASNAPTALAGSGVSGGGNVLVRALTGNMTLRANVSGNNVDLVSNGIFDNTSGNTLTAVGNWQVWGNTWVGENRGGLAGNGSLPNLYGCTFAGACGVTPSASANQFIYSTQPVATLTFTNSNREYGLPNAAINYGVSGLILGDQASNAINGSVVTAATQASNVGNYAIGGNFVSPAGYRLNVLAGVLAITPATLAYAANPFTRLYGDPNAKLTGTVTGFRLSDTLASATTGTLGFTTSATQASSVGQYAINGGGLNATNYVFVQGNGNATALRIDPATLFYVANPLSRLYGDPNGSLAGTVSGFRLADTVASTTTGTLGFTTAATQASNVGQYAIAGGGLVATNYVFAQSPGNATALRIDPATLFYDADPRRRMVGTPNGNLGGTVTGFRNGDTQATATTGSLTFQTSAAADSPAGTYAINGVGLVAGNYLFVQNPANALALTVTPPMVTYTLDVVRDTPVTYVYDRNFGIVGLCPANDLAAGSRDQDGDTLSREWSRVRSRPNLANCVSTRQKDSCGDF